MPNSLGLVKPHRSSGSGFLRTFDITPMKRLLNRTEQIDERETNRKRLSSENLLPAFVFLFSLAVYAKTLCPAVFWWDSGELIANIAVLGIPHRPGFPIYVLLGKLFSLLPFRNFAFGVNLFSAFSASLSLAILCKVFQMSAHLFFPQVARRRGLVFVSSLSFVLVLGFTYSFWIQAVRTEVYSLNVFFFSSLLLLSILYLKDQQSRYVYLFFFLLGLGLANHHLSLLSAAPAFLILFLTFASRSFFSIRKVPFYLLFWLLGLSVYAYLPIRSLSNPPLAWGQVESVSSSASSVFAFDAIANLNLNFLSDAATEISQIASLLYHQLTLLPFAISLMGLFLLLRNNRKILAFLLILMAINCAVVIFVTTEFIPTNPDLHGYLIFSILALAFSYGMGILFVLERVRHSSSVMRYLLPIAFGIISFFPVFRHYAEADLSDNRIAHDYGLSVITGLDSNAVLFVDNVNLNFILRELRYGEGVRKDVSVFDRGLLTFDWYVRQKRRQDTSLFSGIPENLKGDPLFGTLLKRYLDLGKPTYVEFTERDAGLVNCLIPRGYVFRVNETPVGELTQTDLAHQKRWDDDNPFGVDPQGNLFDPKVDAFQRDWDAQRVFALSYYRLGLFYEMKGLTSLALDKFAQVGRVDPENGELKLKIQHLETIQKLSESSGPDSSPSLGKPPG